MAHQSDKFRLTESSSVAEEVRAILARRRISGRALARKLEVTPVYIARRLSGEVEFSESDIRKVARELNIQPGDLFTAQPYHSDASARSRGYAL